MDCEPSNRALAERQGESSSAEELRANFRWFSLQFAVNHGVVTTPLVIATSHLSQHAGFIGNALLNIFTMLSALLFAVPLISMLGVKRTVVLGMSLYCLYVVLFACAALAGKEAVHTQLVLFSIGSCCGGAAAGMLWTAQGSYFARTVTLLSLKEGTDRAQLSSSLAGVFAALYLSLEVASKLAWAAMDAFDISSFVTSGLFLVVGIVSTLLMRRVLPLGGCAGASAGSSPLSQIQAVAALWSDPSLWLLSGLNLTFGFSAAFINGYVNAQFTAKQVGPWAVPMFAACTSLVAAILAKFFGVVGMRTGKGFLLFVGAVSFFCIPSSFFALNRCGGWKGWLIVLYFLQGAGRAVYESTSKGIFADFFPDASASAFANCMLQSASSFATCFFLSSLLTGPVLAQIAMVLSSLTPLGFLGAVTLRHLAEKRREMQETFSPDDEKALGS
uniref:Major facilitator superfamily (MFS) profile domain-containing protein n=1 Tax=Zooxanthella nutricula TaxID=1333877 RepID=A0A7S2N175_9DINO